MVTIARRLSDCVISQACAVTVGPSSPACSARASWYALARA
ncbi:hypothetical protein AB0M60_28875 [Micromonospora wenchangensis]